MKVETKRKIKMVVGGVALASVLASGFYYLVDDFNNNCKYYYTEINFGKEQYILGDLYLLTDGEINKLCTLKLIDKESSLTFGAGISLGNGLMINADGVGLGMSLEMENDSFGSLAFGVSQSTKKIYGYESIETKEIIAISGRESETGYTPLRIRNIITQDYVRQNNYSISNDDLVEILSLNKGLKK